MFTHISWRQYVAFILDAASFYYLGVGVFFLTLKLPSFKGMWERLPVVKYQISLNKKDDFFKTRNSKNYHRSRRAFNEIPSLRESQ